MVYADHRHVGRNHGDVQLVGLSKFRRFGFGRTGHAGQLLVHAEIILERDGGEGLVLPLDLDAFLGFDRLVQSVAPAASRHEASGELVDDDHLAVLDHVFAVVQVQHVRAQALLHVMVYLDDGGVEKILHIEQLFDFGYALFGERHAAMLFIDRVVAGGPLLAGLLAFMNLTFLQARDDAVDLVILVGGFLAGTGDDKRRARFVDQDGIDFVDDGVMVPALNAIVDAELHVVAEIVESVLVVGSVGDVAVVADLPLLVVEVMHDHADGQSQEFVNAAHPFGVALGQVVVDGDHVDSLSGEGIQIHGQSGDQRLTFAGFHLRDFALMQHDAADQLLIEVAHVQNAPAGLAHDGERFHQQVVERGSLGQFFFEFDGFGGEVDVGKLLDLRLERVDRHD